MFDILIMDGWPSILLISVAILELSKDTLMAMDDPAEILTYLTHISTNLNLREVIQYASKRILED